MIESSNLRLTRIQLRAGGAVLDCFSLTGAQKPY